MVERNSVLATRTDEELVALRFKLFAEIGLIEAEQLRRRQENGVEEIQFFNPDDTTIRS